MPNEKAVTRGFNSFVNQGYKGDINDYKELLNTNSSALEKTHEYFVSQGYKGSEEDLSDLFGLKKKDESQPISQEEDTDVVIEDVQENIGTSESSEKEVDVDAVVEEDVITDGSPKIQEQDRGIEETKDLNLEGLKIPTPENVRPTNESINPLTGNSYNINNMMEAASLKVAQEEWDKKYGVTTAQSEENIAGLEAAKEQELKNSAPEKHQEIEERYSELINQEKFEQTQATGSALRLTQKTREFDESLSRTPTEEEKLGTFTLVEEEQTSEPRSIFSLLSTIGMASSSSDVQRPKFKVDQKVSDDTINRVLGEYQTLAEQDVARYFIGDKATAEELNDIKTFQEFANKTLFDKGKTSREKYNILEEEYTRLQGKMDNTSFDKKLDVRAAYEGKNKKQYIIDLNDAELKNYELNGEGDVEMVKMLYTAKRKLDKYLANQPLIDSLNSDGSVNFKEGVDDSAKEVIKMDVKSLLNAVQAAEDNSIATYRDGVTEKRETFGKLVTRIRNAQAKLATLDKNSTEYKDLAARIKKTEADADKMRDEILAEGTQVTSILKTSPDEIIEQTKVAMELSPSARAAFSEKIEGLSSYEQFQRAYHQLREETNRLREEGGFSEGSILGAMGRGARRLLNVKELGLNVGKKEKEWLANRELLNNLAPILLTNTPGISKEDSNFFDAFGAAFAKGLVGESGIKSQTGMIQDQLRGLPELGVTADDYTEEDIVEQLEKITETDLDSFEFWGDMSGSTSAIVGTLGITKRGTGLKKMTTQDALVKRIAKNYNKAMDKNATRRFVKKALQQGVEFETAGIVFDNQQEELSFEGGFLGTLGGELIQKVAGKIPVSTLVKSVASKFGKEGKRAVYLIQRAGEIISRGQGEVAEETIQELTQLYNSNLGDQGFWEAATERFGDFDENMKFIVGSFAMGTAFGMMQPSDVKARYNKLNADQKKRVDDVINTIEDTQKEVVKETIEGEVKKEGKVEEVSEKTEVVYHGSPTPIEGGVIKKGQSGAIFLTPSKKYAEGYKGAGPEGTVTELTITEEKKNNLFDLRNEEHVERLKQGFLNNNEELEIEYDSKEDALKDYNNYVASMRKSAEGRDGLNDWAAGSQFMEHIENAGFDGALFVERPAGTIDEKAVISYALFDKEINKDSLIKTEEDASTKQGPTEVVEEEQTTVGGPVVEGDTESIITTGEGTTEAEIEKGVQETPTEILKTEVVEEFVDLTPKQKTAYKREAKKRMVANKQKTSKASVQKFAEGLHQKEVLIKKEASDLIEVLNNDATVQLQLDGKTVSEEKMNSLVKAAQAKMNEKLPELEEKAEVVDEPAPANVIPITITENTELANKVKKMGLKELVGKKINLVMADQLKVDEKALDKEGKPKQMGGPFFPLMDSLFGKVAWASIDTTAANKIIDGAIKGDYTVVFNMKPSALDSNTVNLNTLIEKVKTADNSVEIFEAMKEDVLGKKIKTNKKIQESKNIDEFAEGFAELGVDDRAKIFKAVLPSADVKADTKVGKLFQDKGISQESIRQENVEQFVSDLPMGAITTVLQVTDKKGNPITKATRSEALITPEQQKAEGLPSHTNYPIYIRGKAIGIMKETVPFWNLNKNYKNTIDLKTAGLIKKRETYKVDIDGEERVVKVSNNPNKTRTVTLIKKGETNKEESSEVIPKSTKTKTTTLITKKFGNIKDIKDIDKKITAKEARSNAYRSATMKASTAFEVTEPTAVQYTQFVRKLSKAFPSVEIVATEQEFDALLKDLNAKALSTKNQKIYGAVYEGKLFLNPALENFNTPVHEFGHIWLNTVKEGRPELYKKGMELVENSDYIQQIKDNADYQRVIKKMRKDGSTEEEINKYIREEALATAIGDQGEAFATAAQERSFKTWLKDLFDYVKKLVGISKVTAEQLQNMTFEEFVESVAVDLLSENELFVEAEVKSFSDALQLMSTPSSNTIDQVIKIGRDNNYSDEAIIEVLKEKKFKLKDINEAMEFKILNQVEPFNYQDTLPKEFMGIEGGITQAIKLYQDTMDKVSKFAIQGPRGGKGKPGVRTKTPKEIQVKALEIIKENPIYKKQSNETQQKIILGFQNNLKENLGVRFREKSVRKELENIKRNLKQIKITDKTIRTKQRELRQFIRASLPKDLGYSVAQINSFIKDIETTTPANFAVKVDKIIEKVKTQEKKIKSKLINDIRIFVNNNTTTTNTSSGNIRSKGKLDKEGIQFFKDMKPILKIILDGDIDKIEKLKQDFLDRQAEIDEIILKETLTVDEQKDLNTLVALDLLEGIQEKSLEEVKSIIKTLQDTAKDSRAQLKINKEVRAERRKKINEEASEQIKDTNPELYNKDGKILNDTEFNQRRKDIYKAFRQGKFVKGWKQFTKLFNYSRVSSSIETAKNQFRHLGTLTNLLDNATKGLNVFRKVIYDSLNNANEQELKGAFETRAKIDDIAKRVGVKEGYNGIKRLLFKGKNKTYSFRVKNTDTDNVEKIDFTPDELMRIYALSLNDVQRAKLEKQGIDDKKIAEIKEILGKEIVEFTDGLVEFLSNSYYEGVNNVYSSINNINLPKIDNYFPTQTERGDVTKDMVKQGEFNSIFQAETAPAFKARVDKESDIKLTASDFTQTLENHVMSMEKYKAYAIPVSNINAFMKNNDVSNLINRLQIRKVLNITINNTVNPYALSKEIIDNKFLNWMQNRFIGFSLAFKIVQIPKQATSFVNAYEDYSFFKKGSNVPAAVRTLIDPLMFTVDVASTYAGITKDIIGMVVPGVKGPIRKAMDVSATFRDRIEKGMKGEIYALESGQSLFKPVSQKMNRAGIIGRGFKTAAGLPTSIGDILGVMGYMVNFNRDIKNGMPLDEAVTKLNNYNATQQTRRGTEKAPIQLSKNYLTRTFTMFGSVVFLQINKALSSMTNIMRSIKQGEKPRRKDIRAFYLNVAIANALFIGVSNLSKLLMGDDEDQEEYWEKVQKALMGANLVYQMPVLGAAIEEWDLFERLIAGLDSEKEYKKKRKFNNAIINPFLSVGYQLTKDVKKYGNIWGSVKPITEIILGTRVDPFIGLFNLGIGSDTEDFEESMYDLLGISKSYRPGAGKKSASKKKSKKDKDSGDDEGMEFEEQEFIEEDISPEFDDVEFEEEEFIERE